MFHPERQHDQVDHPHPLWWVGILGGLTLLWFQGFEEGFYRWYVSHLNPLPSQAFMRGIFFACIPIHVLEAAYAFRAARRLGLVRSAPGWGIQTLFLGFPSTHLILRRIRAAESIANGANR